MDLFICCRAFQLLPVWGSYIEVSTDISQQSFCECILILPGFGSLAACDVCLPVQDPGLLFSTVLDQPESPPAGPETLSVPCAGQLSLLLFILITPMGVC